MYNIVTQKTTLKNSAYRAIAILKIQCYNNALYRDINTYKHKILRTHSYTLYLLFIPLSSLQCRQRLTRISCRWWTHATCCVTAN